MLFRGRNVLKNGENLITRINDTSPRQSGDREIQIVTKRDKVQAVKVQHINYQEGDTLSECLDEGTSPDGATARTITRRGFPGVSRESRTALER